jgi:DNA polymerase-3 subunit gamma/tau
MDSPLQTNLNLARKLRPQTFDTIIGQDISVRMLKNGLYLRKFFPVYLFAGQRGCGKTSTARVFATAINCHTLELFQQKPTQYPVPCLTCDSCHAMLHSQHPDFIEIDAASNTGVDNVRQIIETASYIPLSGRKKIYLIDEAHMLSKAAFNAFLKILEEPPVTVHFILATTELQKIPETVLSRCFQLTFNAINHDSLKTYLLKVCETENVRIDNAALDVLIDETDGSARDALNLLEQVRFSTDYVTIEALLMILGKVSTNVMVTLFEHIVDNKPQQVLQHLRSVDF